MSSVNRRYSDAVSVTSNSRNGTTSANSQQTNKSKSGSQSFIIKGTNQKYGAGNSNNSTSTYNSGSKNKSNALKVMTDSDAGIDSDGLCGLSPTAWICELGKELTGGNSHSRPFFDNFRSNDSHDSLTKKEKSEWRTKSLQTLTTTSDDQSDNDQDLTVTNLTPTNRHSYIKNGIHQTEQVSPISSVISCNRTIEPGSPQEPRIIAPNVAKLSPQSVVEIRLQSLGECVAILCSVDVLKMRSSFFHQVLAEQENNNRMNQQPKQARNGQYNHEGIHTATPVAGIWREPITIPEASPFEAAAFLESLHEGRITFKEWNFCWSRLSCQWLISELIDEFASQIDAHTNNMLTLISSKHWRTSPNTLSGMRVAVFRKSATHLPTCVAGTIIDSVNPTYSKIRVAFDSDPSGISAPSQLSSNNPFATPIPSYQGRNQSASTPYNRNGMTSTDTDSLVGDIIEPFWIQNSKDTTGSAWMDADDYFYSEIKRYITLADKKKFWEMVRAMIEMPELTERCTLGVRHSKDLTPLLVRPENKILWIPEAATFLPKDVAIELLQQAYVLQQENVPNNK